MWCSLRGSWRRVRGWGGQPGEGSRAGFLGGAVGGFRDRECGSLVHRKCAELAICLRNTERDLERAQDLFCLSYAGV
ncbi:hypothetical protein GCM10011578_094270 [Streptomyces fuscichromogenes]|uniref:Uncharacterized protein n=1 Tax=Streptomyces fuscichromogenes TaxID=1324013 RepID=A0A917XP46_9ACTN|nr:hypothetical protein GCM10011578_094270 [Streptomyces fuscichromogenes]